MSRAVSTSIVHDLRGRSAFSLSPPSSQAVPVTSSVFPSTDPMRVHLISSYCPAYIATREMITSVALPKVTFRSAAMVSVHRRETSSVRSPSAAASGTRDKKDVTKATVARAALFEPLVTCTKRQSNAGTINTKRMFNFDDMKKTLNGFEVESCDDAASGAGDAGVSGTIGIPAERGETPVEPESTIASARSDDVAAGLAVMTMLSNENDVKKEKKGLETFDRQLQL